MNIIESITISSAMVLVNTAVNADADYNPGTNYPLDQKCTYNGYIYISLQNANLGHEPGITASVAWWALIGVSNKNAMFDSSVSTTTKKADSFTVTIAATHVDSLTLPYVSGSEVIVNVTKNAVSIYNKVIDLRDSSMITGWRKYWFGDRGLKHAIALTDLPPMPGVEISVTVNYPLNIAEIGMIQIGQYIDVGLESYGLKREIIDYSVPTFDKFGILTIDKQKYSKKYSTNLVIDNRTFDLITEKLDSLASKPVVCLGGNGLYQSLIVFGLISYSVDLRTFNQSYMTIEVKGLV